MIYRPATFNYLSNFRSFGREAYLIYRKDFSGYGFLSGHTANIDKVNEMAVIKNGNLLTID